MPGRRLYSANNAGAIVPRRGVFTKKLETERGDFLTKEELRSRLNLPSTRMVDELMKRRKIPYIRLGHKTVRFSWSKCEAALARFEIREVGR